MSKLSPEEERQLIADAEAARDDPDAPLVSVPLKIAEDAGVSLTLRLPLETFVRLERAARANDLSLGEAVAQALDALEAAGGPPAEEAPEASPPPRRRRKSAKAS
ncbi:MAG: hypothetical protein OXH07_11420 [Chloroflexi bacterium]|nr:hypothetical protein [Chloroflexota bacterium]